MPSNQDCFEAWKEASGCGDSEKVLGRTSLQSAAIKLFKDRHWTTKGNEEDTFKGLWDQRGSAYSLACAIGAAILAKADTIGYVFTVLPSMPEEFILASLDDGEAGGGGVPRSEAMPGKASDSSGICNDKDAASPITKELTQLFHRQFQPDARCKPDCQECSGTGFGIDWYSSGEDFPIGKYGHCRSCLPNLSEPQGLGIWISSDHADQFPGINPQKQAMLQQGWVYFVQDEQSGLIKIGWAVDPEQRIKILQTGSPGRLVLMHKIAGTIGDEKAFHKRFCRLRVGGEWFMPDGALADLVLPQERCQQGWIKLHRRILDHWTFEDPRHWPFKIFCYLMLIACRQPTTIRRFGQTIVLQRGETDCTERQLAQKFKVSRPSMNRLLLSFEQNGEISRRFILRKKAVTANLRNAKNGEPQSEPIAEPIAEPQSEPIAEPIKPEPPIIGFSVISLCNYDRYQARPVTTDLIGGEPIAEPQGEPIAEPIAEPQGEPLNKKKEVHQEEREKKEAKQKQPTAPKKLTPKDLFEVWEKERGPLPAVEVPEYGRVGDLLKHLNEYPDNADGPAGHWVKLIHIARQCHPEHYPKISPVWLSKDLEHVNQVVRGIYNDSFEKENAYGPGTRKARLSGKGDLQTYRKQSKGKPLITPPENRLPDLPGPKTPSGTGGNKSRA
jgi:hypothetical protein